MFMPITRAILAYRGIYECNIIPEEATLLCNIVTAIVGRVPGQICPSCGI